MLCSPIVRISEGEIKGSKRVNINGESFYTFLGIPYGKEPIGCLRFRAPEPVESWSGIKDAITEGSCCLQGESLTLIGSEDCLNLNVFTKSLPKEENKLKPVLTYIHGGAFLFGNHNTDVLGPDFLMTEDIVLVCLTYRVGFLGFLHLNDPALNVPGNAGLKDQQLALKWIQRNIKYFNGDPGNVTICGQSAGAASVQFHILSESSKGLFHRAIMQSGSVLNPWAFTLSDDYGLEFAKSVDCGVQSEKEALEVLQTMPFKELIIYQEKFVSKRTILSVAAPNIEKPNPSAFLTAHPIDLLSEGRYNHVPILMGYCDAEGLEFEYNPAFMLFVMKRENMDLGLFIHPHLNLKEHDTNWEAVKNKLIQFYFSGSRAEKKWLFFTDYYMVMGIIASARLLAKTSKHPVFFYRMALEAGLNWKKRSYGMTEPGASHCDELGYLFNISAAREVMCRGEKEDKYIKRFIKLWTNFVKTANPTPEGNDLDIIWKPIDERNANFLNIGEELMIKINPEDERMKLWKDIFELSTCSYKYL